LAQVTRQRYSLTGRTDHEHFTTGPICHLYAIAMAMPSIATSRLINQKR